MKSFFYLSALILGGFLLHYLALWMESKGWLYYKKKPPAGGGMGSMLEEANRFLRPSIQHVQQEKKRTRRQDQGNADDL